MKSILVISNDQRADDLIRQFQPLLKQHIGSVADFDQGLKEVFDKRPAVVFIQSEIGGISGDAVAKHIKGLLRDDSPKLVLFREAPDKPFASRNTFDDSIDLFAANVELFRQFKTQLEKVPTLQWTDSADDGERTADELPGVMEVEPLAVEQPVQPPPESRMAQRVEDAAPLAGPQSGRHVALQPPLYGTPPLATDATSGTTRKTMSDDIFEAAVPGFTADLPGRSWDTRKPWLYFGGLLVTCAIGVAVFVGPRYWPGRPVTEGGSPAAPQQAAVTPTKNQLRSLPAAIPLSGRDPAYEAGHPGWERYLSEQMEYLVFREGGAIRAIQVISRQPAGIPEEFIRSFLGDATGSGSFSVTGRSDKGGFLAETAILPDKGELMLYRKGPGERVQAFVVAFD